MAAIFNRNKVRQDRGSKTQARRRIWDGRLSNNIQCDFRRSASANTFSDQRARRDSSSHRFRFIFQIGC